MSNNLPKLAVTTGCLVMILSLSNLALTASRTQAQSYPDYPDESTNVNYICNATGICQACSGWVVYGASPTSPNPQLNWGQGSCTGPLGSGTCFGTTWKCAKLLCQYGTPVNPPEYLYNGRWCRRGS
jgi:hypothetical protein